MDPRKPVIPDQWKRILAEQNPKKPRTVKVWEILLTIAISAILAWAAAQAF